MWSREVKNKQEQYNYINFLPKGTFRIITQTVDHMKTHKPQQTTPEEPRLKMELMTKLSLKWPQRLQNNPPGPNWIRSNRFPKQRNIC